jgi:hypothetical protein
MLAFRSGRTEGHPPAKGEEPSATRALQRKLSYFIVLTAKMDR